MLESPLVPGDDRRTVQIVVAASADEQAEIVRSLKLDLKAAERRNVPQPARNVPSSANTAPASSPTW